MKFIYGYLIITALLIVFSKQSTTPFLKCHKGDPPLDLRVNNCTKSPCDLRRGTDVTAEWDFTINEETAMLTPRLKVGRTADRTNSKYPFPEKDACSSLKNATCPLEAGQNVTYVLKMPILKHYPKMPLFVEFAFLNNKSDVIVCFKLSGRVVDS